MPQLSWARDQRLGIIRQVLVTRKGSIRVFLQNNFKKSFRPEKHYGPKSSLCQIPAQQFIKNKIDSQDLRWKKCFSTDQSNLNLETKAYSNLVCVDMLTYVEGTGRQITEGIANGWFDFPPAKWLEATTVFHETGWAGTGLCCSSINVNDTIYSPF